AVGGLDIIEDDAHGAFIAAARLGVGAFRVLHDDGLGDGDLLVVPVADWVVDGGGPVEVVWKLARMLRAHAVGLAPVLNLDVTASDAATTTIALAAQAAAGPEHDRRGGMIRLRRARQRSRDIDLAGVVRVGAPLPYGQLPGRNDPC